MIKPNQRAGILLAAALLIFSSAGSAGIVDNSTTSYGRGQGGVDIYRIGTKKPWNRTWFSEGSWQVSGYWHGELGHWHSDKAGAHEDNLFEISVTPVFRLEQKNSDNGQLSPYLEAGIGVHILGPTSISDRSFSNAVQFGEHLGAGLRFGNNGRYDLGYRYQHLSNGSLDSPNNGMDMHTLNFGIAY